MKFTVQAVSKSKTQIKNFETEYEAKAFIKKCGCSGYIEIGAIERHEEILNADNKSVVNINVAIKDTFVPTSEAAMSIRKMLLCGCITANEARKLFGVEEIK